MAQVKHHLAHHQVALDNLRQHQHLEVQHLRRLGNKLQLLEVLVVVVVVLLVLLPQQRREDLVASDNQHNHQPVLVERHNRRALELLQRNRRALDNRLVQVLEDRLQRVVPLVDNQQRREGCSVVRPRRLFLEHRPHHHKEEERLELLHPPALVRHLQTLVLDQLLQVLLERLRRRQQLLEHHRLVYLVALLHRQRVVCLEVLRHLQAVLLVVPREDSVQPHPLQLSVPLLRRLLEVCLVHRRKPPLMRSGLPLLVQAVEVHELHLSNHNHGKMDRTIFCCIPSLQCPHTRTNLLTN